MPFDRAGECLVCEAGFYCPEEASTNQTTCPAGKHLDSGVFLKINYSAMPLFFLKQTFISPTPQKKIKTKKKKEIFKLSNIF